MKKLVIFLGVLFLLLDLADDGGRDRNKFVVPDSSAQISIISFLDENSTDDSHFILPLPASSTAIRRLVGRLISVKSVFHLNRLLNPSAAARREALPLNL